MLWFGSAVSRFGDFFGDLSLSWIVLQITGSPIAFALNLIISFIPRSAVRLVAGVYVDRWSRKRIMIFTEFLRGSLFAFAFVLNLRGALGVYEVYFISFFVGLLGSLFEMANSALLPSIVGKEKLVSANSVMSATLQSTQIVGYALTGPAILLAGTAFPLAFDSLSYFVLVGALLFITVSGRAVATPPGENWSKQFREGVSYLRERRALLWLAVIVGAINFPLAGLWNVYVLIFPVRVLGSNVAGWTTLLAVISVGIVTGSVVVGKLGEPRRKRDVIAASVLGLGVFIILFGLSTSMLLAALVIFWFGFFIPTADILITSLYQRVIPEEMRGRVFGVTLFLNNVTVPFGTLFAGILAQSAPLVASIVLTGVICIAIAPFMYLVVSLRRLDVDYPVEREAA